MVAPRRQPLALRFQSGVWAIVMLAFVAPWRASAQTAAADTASEAVIYALEYDAPAECPDEGELVARVKRRSQRASRVASGAPVSVRITVSDSPPRGILHYAESGVEAQREVEGADCDEVVTALALVLALLLDPDGEAASVKPPPRVQPRPSAPERRLSPVEPAPASPRLTLGVRGGAARGVADGFVPYIGVSGGALFGSGGLLAPSVRLDVLFARGTADNSSGTAELELFVARAAVCAVALPDAIASPRACATFDGGRLAAQGARVSTPRSAAVAWYGPGAQLGLGVSPMQRLTLSAEAGATVTLVRDSFFFQPEDEVHRIPSIASYLGLALETSF